MVLVEALFLVASALGTGQLGRRYHWRRAVIDVATLARFPSGVIERDVLDPFTCVVLVLDFPLDDEVVEPALAWKEVHH